MGKRRPFSGQLTFEVHFAEEGHGVGVAGVGRPQEVVERPLVVLFHAATALERGNGQSKPTTDDGLPFLRT